MKGEKSGVVGGADKGKAATEEKAKKAFHHTDRGGTSTQKRVFYEINEKLVCANVPSILPL